MVHGKNTGSTPLLYAREPHYSGLCQVEPQRAGCQQHGGRQGPRDDSVDAGGPKCQQPLSLCETVWDLGDGAERKGLAKPCRKLSCSPANGRGVAPAFFERQPSSTIPQASLPVQKQVRLQRERERAQALLLTTSLQSGMLGVWLDATQLFKLESFTSRIHHGLAYLLRSAAKYHVSTCLKASLLILIGDERVNANRTDITYTGLNDDQHHLQAYLRYLILQPAISSVWDHNIGSS